MKKAKKFSEAHTSRSQIGMGDHYGTGVKNPVGTIRRSYMDSGKPSNKSLGKPPKSLA